MAGIDPNIAMSFRLPQMETPFQSLGGALTLRNQMITSETAELERQRRIAFDNEIRNLPEEQRTTENLVKIAAKYAPAKELYHYGQQSMDTAAKIKATQEQATARLQQAAAQFAANYDIRIRNAKTAEEKAYWQQEWQKKRLELESERVRQGAGRLFYETGEDRRDQVPSAATASPISAPVQMQGAPTQQPRLDGYNVATTTTRPSSPAGFPRETPEQYRGAMDKRVEILRQERANELAAGNTENVAAIDRELARFSQSLGGPKMEGETQLVNPPADNLDARDLKARQGVPGVRAAAEAQERLTSQMPPEIQKMYDEARSPKQKDKIKAQWEAGVIKAEIERVKQTAGSKASEDVVKAISDGRMPMPTGFALRSPYWQDVMERVSKVNPNFDASQYGARAAARRTFASGPEARNVTALNTVIGHLGTLDEAAQALNNNNIRMANAVYNRMATELGDPRVQNFDTAKQAVAEETMRVFRQVGASEREAKEWGERITSSGSPAQLRGVINTLGQLLESRVEAIAQQYERTVNQQGNPSKIDPKNRKLLDDLKKPLDDKSKVDSILDKYK